MPHIRLALNKIDGTSEAAILDVNTLINDKCARAAERRLKRSMVFQNWGKVFILVNNRRPK